MLKNLKPDLRIATYPVSDIGAGVTSFEKQTDSHFAVKDADGRAWKFRKIVLAGGMADAFAGVGGCIQYVDPELCCALLYCKRM